MKRIILYDYLLVRGGAENVSMLLAEHLVADLCISFKDSVLFDETNFSSKRYQLMEIGKNHQSKLIRYLTALHAFQHKTQFLANYDWALYSGACAPVAALNRTPGLHYYYCHALPSFAYELYHRYKKSFSLTEGYLFDLFLLWYKPRYEKALQQMDNVIANSRYTQQNIKTFLGLEASVIYPPINTQHFNWLSQEPFYLSTARLEPFKHVDRIIDAFLQMPTKKLLIAGWGSEGPALKRKTGNAKNIEFLGWISPERMQDLVGRCTATVYLAENEAFGISPVESIAAGKPVIGSNDGGVTETIIDGETGVLLERQAPIEEICNAVNHLTSERALTMRRSCEAQAQQFSQKVFLQAIKALPTAST